MLGEAQKTAGGRRASVSGGGEPGGWLQRSSAQARRGRVPLALEAMCQRSLGKGFGCLKVRYDGGPLRIRLHARLMNGESQPGAMRRRHCSARTVARASCLQSHRPAEVARSVKILTCDSSSSILLCASRSLESLPMETLAPQL
jgi:hypothetical protein